LGATFGRARSPEKPLWVGSIKPNIGHLEGASGLAGLTKALYVLEKGLIPPQIWLEKVNPNIRLEEWNLAIPHKLTPWPYRGLRRVSINSFGFGGTNAHAVLDDAYHYMKERGIDGFHNTTILETDELDSRSDSGISSGSSGWLEDKLMKDEKLIKSTPKLIVLSAHEQDGIRRISDVNMAYFKQKLEALDSTEQAVLMDQYAYTTSERRSVLPWKSFAVVSVEDFNTRLPEVAKPVRSSRAPKLGFVFTGQGAQHFSMGRELCAYDGYSDSLRDAGTYLTTIGCPWLLTTELFQDEKSSKVNDPSYSQPICTAIQIALIDLLQDWGIVPSAVVGHSSGEIAAAYAKGAITREAALAIAYHRGRLSSLLSDFAPGIKGGMLAAGVGEEAALLYLEKVTNGEAVVACINSPTSVTISGDLSAILQLETMMKADGLFARQLKVETAYHSPHMRVIAEQYLESLSGIQLLPGDLSSSKMFSSVTGGLIDNSSLGPEYWVSNMLNTVRFSEAVKALLEHSESQRRKRANAKPYVDILVELGPHGALQGPIKQILGSAKAECMSLSILHRGRDAICSALEAVGRLFQQGYPANITAANSPQDESKRKMLVDLPPFSWNHTNKYWYESALASNYRFRKLPRNDLLGLLDDEGNPSESRWRNFFRLSENPWIQDHSVQNTLLYPVAGMMVMALEAAVQIAKPGNKVDGYELRDIMVQNALIIPRDDDGIETMLHLRPWRTGSQATSFDWHEFTIYSRTGKEEWARNCTGLLTIKYKSDARNSIFIDEEQLSNSTHREIYERVRRESPVIESTKQFYDHQFEIGLQFGDTFRNLIEISKGRQQSICSVRIPDIASIMPKNFIRKHVIHPCTLDAMIQALFPSIGMPNEKAKVAAIPTYIERLFVSADISSEPGNVLQTYSLGGYTGLKEAEASIYASVEGWEKPLIVMKCVRLTKLSALTGVGKSNVDLRKVAGELHWQEDISKLRNHDIQILCSNVGPSCDPHAPVVTFMRLATHKSPTMKILEIGAREGAVTAQILDVLAGKDGESTPWFKSYLVTDIDQSAVDKINEQFGSWEPYVEGMVLRIDQDPTRQGLHNGDYDCIIVTDLATTTASIDNALANMRSLLKDGGKLVICDTSAIGITGDGWAKNLHAHRFSEIDCSKPHELEVRVQMPSFLLSTALGEPIGDIPDNILIITAKNPSLQEIALLENIQDAFRILGISLSTISFDQVQDISLSEKTCIMLAEVETPLLFEIGPDNFKQVKRIILESNSLLWVTCGGTVGCENPHLSLVTGLLRTIRQENFGIPFCTLDLDPKVPIGTETDAAFIINSMRELAVVKGDREFAIREGRMMVPRLHLEQGTNKLISSTKTYFLPELAPLKQSDRALTLTIGVPGMLDTLFFKDDESYRYPLKEDAIEIEVKATGLNFMDIMVAMDQVQEPSVGVECSGIVTRIGSAVKRFKPGDGVMTWRLGAFSNFIRNAESMFQPIPCDMTFETAASIPVVYVTAYQALVEAARLKMGEKILIHAAAGGVGQAAVMIAKHLGAEVFVTVGSEIKKAHLIENYGIAEDHIFNSRDLTFADGIKRMTDGKGVDVVLNSLAGEALRLSWLCLAWFGRFIELGKKDISTYCPHPPFFKSTDLPLSWKYRA
jgi:acyl transferase domain-containing protein/D-arabinose 1-dehydrogenase-like Zn-dependent alcohol dehydrogenase